MDEISIPLNKKKLFLLLLGALVFVIIGVWLWQNSYNLEGKNPSSLRLLAIVTLLFFGPAGIFIFVKIFDRKPALIINEEGIIDNASGISAGLIRWENITDARLMGEFLTIEVNNPEELKSRQNFLKRYLMELNQNYFSSPVQIPAGTLKGDLSEVQDLIKNKLGLEK